MASVGSSKGASRSTAAKRLDFRTTPGGVLPSSIDALSRLTLDAAMKAALTHASAKLVIELDAGGTRVLLADARTSQLIGGPEDLQKLGSIRAFVNRERKDALSVEAAKDVTQLGFLAEKLWKDNDTGFEMKPVDNSYGAALRPLHSALSQLIANEKMVTDNTCQVDRSTYEPHFHRLFAAARNAYTDVILTLSNGESIKGRLKDKLFENGVPDWVHSRIVSKTFKVERTEELSRFFFPADPTKGLALTVKEWQSDEFCEKQGFLLRCSHLIGTFLDSEELVRAITGIAPEISLKDKENPLVAKLLEAKAVAVPATGNVQRVIDVGAKSKSGFKFPTPGMDTVTGSIVALSTAILRVYSANLQTVDLVGDYYATVAPGAVSRQAVTPTNNFYVQWGKSSDCAAIWKKIIVGGNNDMNLRRAVWRWLRTELRFSERGEAGKALARTLELKETGELPDAGHQAGIIIEGDPEGLGIPQAVSQAAIATCNVPGDLSLHLTRPLRETEIPFWLQFQERVFPSNAGKKKGAVGTALTPLSAQGKQLVARVSKLSPYVSERMTSWLRSFSDERLQLAAIRVTNAEFDDIFSSSLDEDDAESVQDWAETEA